MSSCNSFMDKRLCKDKDLFLNPGSILRWKQHGLLKHGVLRVKITKTRSSEKRSRSYAEQCH